MPILSRNIEVWPDYDPQGVWRLNIKKKRGTLTVEEIRQAATQYEQDFYMMVIKALDDDMDQYYDSDDLGDYAQLYSADKFFEWRQK